VDLSADYVKPLRQGRVEAGFKGRYRSIPVDMQFFAGERSPIDTGAGGWATYRETIPRSTAPTCSRASASSSRAASRRGRAGRLRRQPDHNTYRSDGYRYLQPFPNVRAAYKFDEANKLSLFVNRRVDRPNEVDIRIFPKYDEPELIKVGNPALQPQYSTSAELGFRTGWSEGSVYAAAYHRVVDGTITRIATQVPGSVLLYNVFQNGGRSWSTGSEVVWQQTLSRACRSAPTRTRTAGPSTRSPSSTVSRAHPLLGAAPAADVGKPQGERGRHAAGRVADAAVERLPAPDLLPQGRVESRFSLDVGAKKAVQRGKGEIVANATDVLNTNQARRTIRGTDFTIVSTDYLETQVIRVGYNRKLRLERSRSHPRREEGRPARQGEIVANAR
jgi:hypothetical protein